MTMIGDQVWHKHWLLDFFDMAWEDVRLDMHLNDMFYVSVITVLEVSCQ